MTTPRLAPLAAALLLASGCGGSSGPATEYAVTGTVAGLAGSNLVLHLGPASPGQDLSVTSSGPFAFPGRLADATAYAVTVKTPPSGPTQTCQVAGGTGTIAGADAAVRVTCTTDAFAVGGAVSGLAGGTLVLRNNGGDDVEVTSDGPFAFAAPVASGAAFAVAVAQQPGTPSQTCVVSGGTGAVVAAAVTSVVVTCEPNDKPVAGTVAGLAGTGLALQANGGFDTQVAGTSFSILTNLASGQPYAVTVKAHPVEPTQTCLVANGTGTMGATGAGGVVVTCTTDAFAVGGAVGGLLQGGLTVSLTVAGAKGPPLALGADLSSFAFPGTVPSGQAYLVTVESSPPTQVCAVANEGGVVGAGPVADVTIACACAPGLASCSQLAPDGCEVSLLADAGNCGGCGHACAFPNGQGACSGGTCQLAACGSGFASCNGDAGDGCEADLSSDPAHCGGCGVSCLRANATGLCLAGFCRVACLLDFGDCNVDLADGCEVDLRRSAGHCGACDRPCVLDHATPACSAGTCAVAACVVGFGNCDGQAANGCERDLATDPDHCGACGRPCSRPNASSTCTAGLCGLGACHPGFDDCDADPVNGCESPVSSDPANCGACGLGCDATNGTAACLDSQCSMSACNPGWGDCAGSAVPGCETDTTGDPQHCGACGVVCGAGDRCIARLCVSPASCREILLAGASQGDGVYAIDPDGGGPGAPVDVWCDMTTDGGGWTYFAHVNDDYQAGRLFEVDVGTYSALRADGGVSYGRGGSVYQHLAATELMVTLDGTNLLTALAQSKLVFYRFAPGSPAFTTGPVPCSGLVDGGFQYRTALGAYTPGTAGACDDSLWFPFSALGDELVVLNGSSAVGTYWGSGLAPPGTPGVDTFFHDSWWYAR
jgi:hypothetical protein